MSDVSDKHVVYISRTESVSASHRLHNSKLTDEDNKALYGKCNNPNGHGHNYKIGVTLRGPVDQETGMLININDLKTYMDKAFVSILDHKNLDTDVPYFKERVSTAENISVFIWKRMSELLPSGLLYKVKVHETNKNTAVCMDQMCD